MLGMYWVRELPLLWQVLKEILRMGGHQVHLRV
jgi:hypothetical protein